MMSRLCIAHHFASSGKVESFTECVHNSRKEKLLHFCKFFRIPHDSYNPSIETNVKDPSTNLACKDIKNGQYTAHRAEVRSVNSY